MGIVGDWIVCISVSAAESRAMETLKLIKRWRRPPPPKQLVTGWSPAGSMEAPAAARRRPEVPSLLRLCVTAAALQKDRQNPQKSMDALQRQHRHHNSGWLLLLAAVWRLIWLLLTAGFEKEKQAEIRKKKKQPFSNLEDYLCFWMAGPQTVTLTSRYNSKHRSMRDCSVHKSITANQTVAA